MCDVGMWTWVRQKLCPWRKGALVKSPMDSEHTKWLSLNCGHTERTDFSPSASSPVSHSLPIAREITVGKLLDGQDPADLQALHAQRPGLLDRPLRTGSLEDEKREGSEQKL